MLGLSRVKVLLDALASLAAAVDRAEEDWCRGKSHAYREPWWSGSGMRERNRRRPDRDYHGEKGSRTVQ